MTFLYNSATGARHYRRASARRLARVAAIFARKGAWLWTCEIAGVALLSVAAWAIYAPAALIVAGLYAIIVANVATDS